MQQDICEICGLVRKPSFVGRLSYSKEHDILIQAGRASRDMIYGEPTDRITAYRGKDGAVLWNRQGDFSGPCILHGTTIYLNTIISHGAALNLLTGKDKTRTNPLTGRTMPWTFRRFHNNKLPGNRARKVVCFPGESSTVILQAFKAAD